MLRPHPLATEIQGISKARALDIVFRNRIFCCRKIVDIRLVQRFVAENVNKIDEPQFKMNFLFMILCYVKYDLPLMSLHVIQLST